MAEYNNTTDLKNEVLQRVGEVVDGTSDFESRSIDLLNDVYLGLFAGGNEFGIDVDEAWNWAKAEKPIILTLLPAYDTGSVTLTLGSTEGTFSGTPAESQQGRFLKIEARDEYFIIRSHTAGASAFEIDQAYTEDSGSFNFRSIKLDYELSDDLIHVDSDNNKIDFQEATATPLVATLTNGVYSTADLAVEMKTQLEASGGETYTITFDSLTRKWTAAHGGAFLEFLSATGANRYRAFLPQISYEVADLTGLTSYEASRPLNSIDRLVRPMTTYRDTELNTFFLKGTHPQVYANRTSTDSNGKIFGVDFNVMLRDYPMVHLSEGVPDRFAEVKTRSNGIISVRFNRYSRNNTRVEVDYIPIPQALRDNAASVPLIPRAYRSFLVHAASYYIMLEKSDNKAQTEFALAQAKLQALVNANRERLRTPATNYARLIPRRDRRGF